MMVGYAKDHAGDVYRMWNPETNGIRETRDVIWLRRMFYEKVKPTFEVIAPVEIDPNDDVEQEHQGTFEVGEGENQDEDTDDVTGTEEEEDEALEEVQGGEDTITTRSGRVTSKPTRLIEEMGACSYEIGLSAAEQEYYDTTWKISEMALVGAGIGGGFVDTNELHVMKFKEAMAGKDSVQWQKAVDEEHERMQKHRVWEPVPIKELPKGSKVLTSTWAMKKKANGTYRARMNARGYEQIDGVHYDENSKAAPVANEIVIRMTMVVLIVMASWCAELLDVQGAFLTGEMDQENDCYLRVPEGFSKFYPENIVLPLLKTLYGLKQNAYVFWKSFVMAFRHMTFERSKADPCLFFKWTEHGLVLWVTWVDDCLLSVERRMKEF